MAAGNTYTPIAQFTLTASQASISFSSISSAYTDLVLVCSAKSLNAGTDSFGISVNGVGSGYSRTYLQGDTSAAQSGRQTAQIRIVSDYVMGTSGTQEYGVWTWHFMNYANTAYNKTVLFRGNNTSNSGGFNVEANVYLHPSTSAISSLTIATMNGPNWAIGSTFALYGIVAA